MASIKNKFSVIGISETWLSHSDHAVDIDGYNVVHNHRPNRPGGGVGMYLDVDSEFKFRNDLAIDNESFSVESLFIEVCRPKRNNLIGGVIYRPLDSDVNDLVKNVNSFLTKINKENKVCYVIGDFNLNVMNHQSHNLTGEFLDMMYCNTFFP